MIFPFWFIDKSALAYSSSSWTNPIISMQMYRYMLVMYRYNFTTVNFRAGCTSTCLSCTDTMCPLPIFKQVVPVHVWVVPVQWSSGAFLVLLKFPRLHQLFARVLSASYWLPGHTSLYTYVLDLKDLHKSKNIEDIKSTYPYAKCG